MTNVKDFKLGIQIFLSKNVRKERNEKRNKRNILLKKNERFAKKIKTYYNLIFFVFSI